MNSTPIIEADFLAVVRAFVAELHGTTLAERVSVRSRLVDELALDSLSRVELMRRVEEKFGVSIPERACFEAADVRALFVAARGAGPVSPTASVSNDGLLGYPRASSAPESATTFSEVLNWHAEHNSQALHVHLLGEQEEFFTYQQFSDKALPIAWGLLERGVRAGDRVALMLPTGSEFLATYFGILLAGAVPVPLYPPMAMDRLEEHIKRQEQILRSAGAVFMIALPEAALLSPILLSRVPALKAIIQPEECKGSFSSLLPKNEPHHLALIQYTSGSTGNPKGVMLSHANLLANIRSMGKALAINSDEVCVSWLPLYHDMGLIGAWLGSLYFGVPLVLMSPLYFLAKPIRWLQAISKYRGTISAGPNFAYQLCVDRIPKAELSGLDLSSWRIAFNGAEPVSAQTLRHFTESFSPFGFRAETFKPVYGLAENSLGVLFPRKYRAPHIQRVDRSLLQHDGVVSLSDDPAHSIEAVSCGSPIPDHEVRLLDTKGQELPDGKVGLLQFKGPSASNGYLGNEVATKAFCDGEWRNSGDYAFRLDGEYFITGRAKDLIIRAGRNIYPQDIEEAVGQLTNVRRGCVAAFGSHDPIVGTEQLIVVAETRLATHAEKLHLEERMRELVTDLIDIAPDVILLVPPRTIPKTSSGKLRRSECRIRYEQNTLLSRTPWWLQALSLYIKILPHMLLRQTVRIGQWLYLLWCWSLFAFAMLVGIALISLMPSLLVRRQCCRLLAKSALFLAGIRVRIEGLETIPSEPVLLACNHASYLDAIVLTAALPPRFGFVAKRDFANSALMHWLLRLVGTQFVDRADGQSSVEDSKTLEQSILTGQEFIFFPEGTFRYGSGLLPFRMGAFVIAAHTGKKLMCLGMRGTRKILGLRGWMPSPGKVVIKCGSPLSAIGSDWSAAVKLREAARAEIATLSGESF